jgi:hypothetical protein
MSCAKLVEQHAESLRAAIQSVEGQTLVFLVGRRPEHHALILQEMGIVAHGDVLQVGVSGTHTICRLEIDLDVRDKCFLQTALMHRLARGAACVRVVFVVHGSDWESQFMAGGAYIPETFPNLQELSLGLVVLGSNPVTPACPNDTVVLDPTGKWTAADTAALRRVVLGNGTLSSKLGEFSAPWLEHDLKREEDITAAVRSELQATYRAGVQSWLRALPPDLSGIDKTVQQHRASSLLLDLFPDWPLYVPCDRAWELATLGEVLRTAATDPKSISTT